MPWLTEPRTEPCKHPARPKPRAEDVGRRWQCGDCLGCWVVEFVDYGHDVMAGEPSSEYRWRTVK